MNTINGSAFDLDHEILKVLLPESRKSRYEVRVELDKKFGEEEELSKKVRYASIHRHLKSLVEKGFIDTEKGTRKDGKLDNRNSQIHKLSYKGLIFLLLKANLDDKEIKAAAANRLLDSNFQKFEVMKEPSIKQIYITSFEKALKDIRPRVNLEYYDEAYVKAFVSETLIIKCVLEEVTQRSEEWFVEPTSRVSKRLRRKAKRDLKELQRHEEWIKMVEEVYEHLKMKRKDLNGKINLLKTLVKEFKSYKRRKKG